MLQKMLDVYKKKTFRSYQNLVRILSLLGKQRTEGISGFGYTV